MSILNWLLDPSGLTAHGFCLSWAPGLIALHAGSDALIALAYFAIPLALVVTIRGRRDMQHRWVFGLFAGFIFACGMTHLFSILTLWVPVYGLEGVVKLIAALLSVATAGLLWWMMPKILAMPSAPQLGRLNVQLAAKVAEQTATSDLLRESETRVRLSNVDLERRVAARTTELVASNLQLTQTLQALANSEEEFRVGFEESSVGKVQSDAATGRIIRTNRAFAAMLGYSPEDLTDRSGWDFTWPADRVAEQAAFARVQSGEVGSYSREKRYLRRDGSYVWGRASALIVRGRPNGQPDLAVAVVENIDEQYRAREALRITAEDLKRTVRERTAALAERDLLLREVYHRVKNNLQIVDSLLVLQGRELADPAAKAALTALRGRVYALGLVHQQLMNSPDLKTFDIAPFLKELSANLVGGGATAGVKLSVRAAPLDVGLDFAIPLGLLVTELVSNSLKHAFPDGIGEIEVLLDRIADGTLELVVSDNGHGPADPSPGPASSLGLKIIDGLVAQLHGVMTVRHDQGTRSQIRLAPPLAA